MVITYGYKWFRAKKRLTEVWDESRAKNCHEQRTLYTVVLGDPICPTNFIEINNDYVGVGFLDDLMREYLRYSFVEIEEGMLFLNEATHREFDETSDNVKNGTSYIFKPNGNVKIIYEDVSTNTRSAKETHADVSGNWEPYPQFSQYQSILRENR